MQRWGMATKILDNTMEVEFTTGWWVTVNAINLKVLERFDLEHEPPDIPQREAEVLGGIEMIDDLDDEDYQEALAEYNSSSMQDLLNMFVLFGMNVELPKDDSWIDKLAFSGIVVDEESFVQMLIDYVQMILMGDLLEDLKRLMSAIFLLSGIEEEAIQQWMTMF